MPSVCGRLFPSAGTNSVLMARTSRLHPEGAEGAPRKGSDPDNRPGQSWVAEHKYGTGPEEIIETVVKIWLSKGMRDPDVGDVWFGTTAVLEE